MKKSPSGSIKFRDIPKLGDVSAYGRFAGLYQRVDGIIALYFVNTELKLVAYPDAARYAEALHCTLPTELEMAMIVSNIPGVIPPVRAPALNLFWLEHDRRYRQYGIINKSVTVIGPGALAVPMAVSRYLVSEL